MLKRTVRNSIISLGFMGLAACGGGTTTPPPQHATEQKSTGDKADTVAPGTAKSAEVAAPMEKAENALPTKVTSLFQFVGKDTPVVVNIPRLDKVVAALDPETREAITTELFEKIKKESRFEAAVAKSLVDSFEGAVIFSDPDKKTSGAQATEDAACVVAKFRDGKPVELTLSSKNFERNGPRFTATDDHNKEKVVLHGVWLADSGVLLGCATPEALARSLSVATGTLPSYANSPRFVAERARDVFASVDMHPIIGDSAEPGSDLFAALTTTGQTLGLDLRLNLYGPSYPPVGSVVAPASQTSLGQMPKGTVGALGISLKRAPGKDLASVITLLDKATNDHKLEDIKRGTAKIGVELGDIDAALGDDLAIGYYRNSKDKFDFDKGESLKNAVALLAISTKDQNAHEKLWNAFTTAIKKKATGEASVQGNAVESVENPKAKKKEFIRVESRKGIVILAVGNKALVKEALAKFGKDTLATNAVFSEARAKEKSALHMLFFLDGVTLKALIASNKSDKPAAPATGTGPAFLSLLLGPTDRGVELALGGGGAMELIGTGANLALNAFKAYTADTKSAEARMNVRFISEYARRAYQRENADGKGQRLKLCKSSTPVPTLIPKGTVYKTTMASGGDWDTGDDDSGWKCLGYFSSEEVRYQYEYRQGGNYKGPKRGGPNPGPNGFEVSAEGDTDADGKTSLFTRTGKIVGGKVVLDDDVFSSDPGE
ncbi:MAG TPA: hypothetical protein PK156_12700 [Polyangium sp.]|nr:hypothetical protein [Polyangium sp.]